MYSLREYIELPSVVQIQYTLDIHGTTITCIMWACYAIVQSHANDYNMHKIINPALMSHITTNTLIK